MPEDFSHLSDEERLKAENEFMKMKLMLEKGAQFSMEDDLDLPAETENEFLKHLIEFETQYDERKIIRVFDKIGQPTHFTPVREIPDDEIDKAWNELAGYLHGYGISLDACSPNISVRESYRFTTEELFGHEMEDMDMPGMMHGFIYDEFHPDPVYDNTRAATDDCINYILQKEPIEWTHHFQKENLRLNGHYPLTIEELKSITGRFKSAYDELETDEIISESCSLKDNTCLVNGTYALSATIGTESYSLTGRWTVVFEKEEASGNWYITEVIIEGISF